MEVFVKTWDSAFGNVVVTEKTYEHFKIHLTENTLCDYFISTPEEVADLLEDVLLWPHLSYFKTRTGRRRLKAMAG